MLRTALLFLATILAALFYTHAEDKTGVVSGRILESGSLAPISYCTVSVEKTSVKTQSDEKGYYIISDVPVGTQIVTVRRDGYRTQSFPDIEVKNGIRTTLNIKLDPEASQSFSMESSADYFSKPGDTTTSYEALSNEEIRRAPGAVEDVNLVLQSLPGVAPSDDRGANVVVRGGMPGENLTLVDGFDTGAVTHFSSELGAITDLFCTINSKIVNDVEFYAGGFPARFGDRLSSVTNINLKAPSTDRIHGEGDFNMAGTSASLQAPIIPGFAIMGAGRYSFIEILNSFVNVAGESVPHFYDWQGKGLAQLSDNQQLEILALGAVDELKIDPGVDGNENAYHYFYSNSFAGLGHDISWSGGVTSSKLSYGKQHWINKYNELYSESDLNNLKLEAEHRMKLSDVILARFGVSGRLYELDMDYLVREHWTEEGELIPEHESLLTGNPQQIAGYSSFEFNPGLWSITAGARYDQLSLLNQGEINPRFGASYRFSPHWMAKASAGRFTQFPAISEIVLYDSPDVLSESAYHYIVGMEYEPAPAWLLSLETYYKDMVRLTTTDVSGSTWQLGNNGKGNARGVEVAMRRQFADSYFFMLSYSLSQSRQKEGSGEWYARDYDQPNILSIQGGVKPSPNWYFGTKWRYASGRPYTPIVGKLYNATAGEYFAVMGDTNSARYPNYNRIDIRIERKDYPGGLTLVTYAECWNIMDNHNVIAYDWNDDYSERSEVLSMLFVPALGFSLEF